MKKRRDANCGSVEHQALLPHRYPHPDPRAAAGTEGRQQPPAFPPGLQTQSRHCPIWDVNPKDNKPSSTDNIYHPLFKDRQLGTKPLRGTPHAWQTAWKKNVLSPVLKVVGQTLTGCTVRRLLQSHVLPGIPVPKSPSFCPCSCQTWMLRHQLVHFL